MPIPLPTYDDRRWSDLVAEALTLAPGLAPGVTDFNAHDPGVTLYELIAWLVEGDLYRLNRVPDAHRRKFLALVGRPPRPPASARATAGLAAAPPGQRATPIGAEFAATALDGTPCVFRTRNAIDPALPAPTAALVQVSGTAPPVDRSGDLLRSNRLTALGDDPAPGAAAWLGFAQPLPIGVPLRLHLTFSSGRSGPEERRRIVAEIDARRLACRRPGVPAPCDAGGAGGEDAPEPSPLAHHDARLAWDYYGASGWTTLDARDETRAFSLDGSVTFTLPAPATALTVAGKGPFYWLRARLASGMLDTPPIIARVVVNALDLEQAAATVGRHPIAPGATVSGAPAAVPGRARVTLRFDADGGVDRLAFDQDPAAPEAEVLGYRPAGAGRGVLVLDLAALGISDETPDQSFALPAGPVRGDSLEVFTLEPPATAGDFWTWQRWALRADFDAAKRGDRFATADLVSGLVRFGDGNRGFIPPDGSRVFARCLATVGAGGDVKAGAVAGLAPGLRNWLLFDDRLAAGQRFAAANLDAVLAASPATAWRDVAPAGYKDLAARFAAPAVTQPDPASGGADAEDLDSAAGAAVAALAAPTRAVTAADYLDLALGVPGTALARAEVAPGRHPALGGLKAPGVVTVIVVPARRAAQPTPSPGLLEAVRRYLDRRRIVGTFAAVVGPTYLVVSVIATVQAAAGSLAARVLDDVTAALNLFLDPLRGGPAAIPAPPSVTTASAPGSAQVSVGVTNAAGAVNAVGPSGPTPIPGVQLLAATTPALPPPPSAPAPPPGWPFGRGVYFAEVLEVIQSVAGVDHVAALELSGDGGTPSCGDLCVGPLQLVAPGTHQITVA